MSLKPETAFSLIHMLSTQFKGYPQMLSFLFLSNLSQTDLFSLSFLAECVIVSYSTLPFFRNYYHPAGIFQNVLQRSKTICTCSTCLHTTLDRSVLHGCFDATIEVLTM